MSSFEEAIYLLKNPTTVLTPEFCWDRFGARATAAEPPSPSPPPQQQTAAAAATLSSRSSPKPAQPPPAAAAASSVAAVQEEEEAAKRKEIITEVGTVGKIAVVVLFAAAFIAFARRLRQKPVPLAVGR